MKKTRRDFLKVTGLAGIGFAGANILNACASGQDTKRTVNKITVNTSVTILEDGSELTIPFWYVDSGKEGPSLALIAAQHGNEVQGAEVARRFKDVCTRELVKGSVWMVPMANLLAVRSRRHSFDLGPEENNNLNPEKLHNMQRHWPGDPNGNDTSRLAYALDQNVLRHCSHMVDMHCWNHFSAAETLSEENHDPSRAMGEVTTTRFISYRNTVIPQSGKMMISQMILKRGGAALVMELSGQFQMQEKQVETGLGSMVNIAKLLGMIEGDPEMIKGPRAIRSPETSHEVKASCSGIFMPALRSDKTRTIVPDDYISAGDPLGHIIREKDLETIPVVAPVSGYLRHLGTCHWGLCDASLPAQHPYTETGETLAMIVRV